MVEAPRREAAQEEPCTSQNRWNYEIPREGGDWSGSRATAGRTEPGCDNHSMERESRIILEMYFEKKLLAQYQPGQPLDANRNADVPATKPPSESQKRVTNCFNCTSGMYKTMGHRTHVSVCLCHCDCDHGCFDFVVVDASFGFPLKGKSRRARLAYRSAPPPGVHQRRSDLRSPARRPSSRLPLSLFTLARPARVLPPQTPAGMFYLSQSTPRCSTIS